MVEWQFGHFNQTFTAWQISQQSRSYSHKYRLTVYNLYAPDFAIAELLHTGFWGELHLGSAIIQFKVATVLSA